MSGADDQPSDTMRERVPENSRKFWVLLNADRWLVAGGIVGAVFVALVAAGLLHPTPVRTLLTDGDPLETLYQALVGSTITGVTLVLTLSQLVLSQEQGPIGDQRERMEGAMSFRADVEDVIGEPVSPAQPSAFLRSLVKLTERRAQALEDAVGEIDDDDLTAKVATYVENLEGNAETVASNLEGSQFGEFDVVFSALNYNYSWKLYAARRIRAAHADALSESAAEAFDELIEALELFGPAREHFKTLYFQWELTDLSRTVLYASVPAIAVAVGALLFFDPSYVSRGRVALVVAALTVSVTLTPFAILLAYVLRIVTVTKRTLSIGPFILRETDRSHDLDWDETGSAGGERREVED
ncbi:hypothetical protein [Halarchaeum nitratireducens]|uniref:Uncharacterized protein n=1 Tax=Halarchaeum nitratireducens TaxID=489913 RepID=A0A830G7Z2_9EURY|nr:MULTISPECIES: hypothetical protein [Halarchaeum]MBP2251410.1 hypothetical protein [Halarchaeum solikamskense]GGN07474.1 hypothetical protein GCM10009021_03310 [Halarchaeum nitratireducens]